MKLNLQIPLNHTSYGYVSYNMARELVQLGHDISVTPIGMIQPLAGFEDCVSNSTVFPNVPTLKIWHQHDLYSEVGNGPKVGMPIFELEQFSQNEKDSINHPDHIIVCSEWARRVVVDQTNQTRETVTAVPLGYDPEIFHSVESPIKDKLIFLNCGKFEIRKGHDILLEMFSQAFSQEDDVELWLLPHNQFLSPTQTKEWQDYYLNSKLGNKIRIYPRLETQADVAQIMRSAHVGVFPARGEGWNLELLEMMAMGKTVIATNNTAHTEYCTNDNSILVDTPSKESAFDGVFFGGRHEWYDVSTTEVLDAFVYHMRRLYHDPPPSKTCPNIEKLTWKNMAEKTIKCIESRLS